MSHPDEVVTSVAAAHAARIRRPFGRCREASERLAADLIRKGVPARVLRCADGRMHAPDADRRWLRMSRAPASWVHYVVQVGDVIVDLTRRQFYPDAPHPHFASVADLASEWQTIAPLEPIPEGMPR